VGSFEHDALVLDHHPYRDRHLLISLLTAEAGVVRGVLRRARGGKAPQAAAAQILSRVHATGFAGARAELATFRQLDLLTSSYPVAADLDRAGAAAVVCELLLTFCPEGEPAPRRYRLGVKMLDALLGSVDPRVVVAYTQFWILVLAGLMPAIEDSRLGDREIAFLRRCRAEPVTAMASTAPEHAARWLDHRIRAESERRLTALEFFRSMADSGPTYHS
jgi:DNA repair protein RecO